jgi:phenylalanyl-tRNA synthetase beta chain
MKASLSWLKKYLDLNIPVSEIAAALTLGGLEVEKIEGDKAAFEGVVVGKVLTVNPHPNAERLRIATVFDGKEQYQVVCGAPNCKAGMKTAFAKIGAVVQDEKGATHKIKKSKIRDVESFGMLCAEKELGLSEAYEWIMDLPQEFLEGTDLAHLIIDPVLEISLTPNLGHCMSILGLARELSALLNLKLKRHRISVNEDPELKIEDMIKVEVQDNEQCLRYACRIIKDVKVGPSPDWLKKQLESVGLHSINNIVDITNLVMLEYGEPLHAFDYEKIAGKKILISSNISQKSLMTLDDQLREIPAKSLLICDQEKPLAFAGVMGGKNSAISESTKHILLEAAFFTPQAVRKTSKALNLRTEASQRFEKGVDPEIIIEALEQATSLIQQIASGKIVKGIIDEKIISFQVEPIICRVSRVNLILGTQLSVREVTDMFRRLEITVTAEDQEVLCVVVPTYRHDLRKEIDLIEEIGRIFGYNNIEKKAARHISSSLCNTPLYSMEKKMRERLISEGLQECITCDLISPALAQLTTENTTKDVLINVLHPASIDQSVLRPSLLPGLLQVVKFNSDHQTKQINAFEIGKIHFKEGSYYKEQTMIGIILAGHTSPYHWESKSKEMDFFDLKGKVENLLISLGINNAIFEQSHLHNFHSGRQARIKVNDFYIGALGEVHPSHLVALDIGSRTFFAELNLHALFHLEKKQLQVMDIPAYPGSERDWTFTVKEELHIDNILNSIQQVHLPLLEKVVLLDLYRSPQLGKDRKNVTLRFLYREKEKTISLEAVEREHAKMMQEVVKKLRDYFVFV